MHSTRHSLLACPRGVGNDEFQNEMGEKVESSCTFSCVFLSLFLISPFVNNVLVFPSLPVTPT